MIAKTSLTTLSGQFRIIYQSQRSSSIAVATEKSIMDQYIHPIRPMTLYTRVVVIVDDHGPLRKPKNAPPVPLFESDVLPEPEACITVRM